MSVSQKLDAAQKATKPTGVAVATFKKFSEDKSTNLASMIAFWAFFSIFPLFMVMVTVLGWVLSTSAKNTVLTHVAAMFPLLDVQTVKGLTGAWWALIVGGFSALWSGLAVVRTVQTAFNSVWEIPYHQRPRLIEQILRSLWVLCTIGVGLVVTALISGFVTSNSNGVNLGIAGRVAGYVLAAVLAVGLFVAAFRMLTDREITTRDVLPGAIFSELVFFYRAALLVHHRAPPEERAVDLRTLRDGDHDPVVVLSSGHRDSAGRPAERGAQGAPPPALAGPRTTVGGGPPRA